MDLQTCAASFLPFPSLALTVAMWSMLQFTEQLPRKWASGREGCTGARITDFARPDGCSRAQGLSAVFDVRGEPMMVHTPAQTDRCTTDRRNLISDEHLESNAENHVV
jgi:hypothetical protein